MPLKLNYLSALFCGPYCIQPVVMVMQSCSKKYNTKIKRKWRYHDSNYIIIQERYDNNYYKKVSSLISHYISHRFIFWLILSHSVDESTFFIFIHIFNFTLKQILYYEYIIFFITVLLPHLTMYWVCCHDNVHNSSHSLSNILMKKSVPPSERFEKRY